MRSLRRQLLRTLTLTLLAVFITQGFVLYGALVHLATSQTLLHLSHDSESVLSAIDVDGKGQLTLDKTDVAIDIKLGFLFSAFKPTIEKEVHKFFDENFPV